jgi:hypothetical protein
MNTTSRADQVRALQIRILDAALGFLRAAPNEDKEMRVCGAIKLAHNAAEMQAISQWRRDILRQAVDGLLRTIEERLAPCGSVNVWVFLKVHSALAGALLPEFAEDHPDMIAYRRAWVEDMIRTLRNGGEL